MSTPISAATAAPIEISIGNKEWKLAPITLKGFGELEQWMRSKIVSVAREAASGLSSEEYTLLIRTALDKAAHICLMAAKKGTKEKEEIDSLMSSIDGIIKIISLSAKRNHPNITDDEVMEIIAAKEVNPKSLIEDIMRISGQETFRRRHEFKK